MSAAALSMAPASVGSADTASSFVFPRSSSSRAIMHSRHDPVSTAVKLTQPIEPPKQRSPSRTHAHRRSAAISHDLLADLQAAKSMALPVVPRESSTPTASTSPPTPDLTDGRSCSVSLTSSSAASLVSVSSVSTSPPSKAKVMFSSAVEFIPSHSTTTSTSTMTSTSTVTTITPNETLSHSSRRSQKNTKSWSFIRFRRRSASDSDYDEDDEDDSQLPLPRPATPPKPSPASQEIQARSTHYFTRSGTPEPMIDLDAALGPAGTPPLLSGSWSSPAVHRRSESAPEVLWTGTKTVDFETFIASSASSSSGYGARGMKRKMSAVVEVEEAVAEVSTEETHTDDVFSPVTSVPEVEENKRRSIWEEFVKSFESSSQVMAEIQKTDDETEEIFGEPGPEIRHGVPEVVTSASTIEDLNLKSLNPSTNTADSPQTKPRQQSKDKKHGRQRSLVLSLKNAMLKSASVSNLPDTRSKKLEDEKFGQQANGWKSEAQLPILTDMSTTDKNSKVAGSKRITKRSLLPVKLDEHRLKRGVAFRVWEWVRGIVA
ncbi:hypothetical protein V1512DRAFT_257439 [Lipomyces arxii]|uniref:uncharacterized protein n=1 Tax=Lipomyces arxii TaxID=56418 RepID=UPI0034CFEE8F